jgi:hypothetical protein
MLIRCTQLNFGSEFETIQLWQRIPNSLQNTQFGRKCLFAANNSISAVNYKFTAEHTLSTANYKFTVDNTILAANADSLQITRFNNETDSL